MIVLGIETSTQICSAALTQDGRLLADYRINIKNAHARHLFNMISHICTVSGNPVNKLDGLAVSIGPGSFTGLRIGLAAVKGLAIADHIPVTAVSTMQALAMQAPVMQGIICPVIKSRNREYYMALFERSNGEDSLLKETTLVKHDEVNRFIPANCLLIGHTDDFTSSEMVVPGLQIAPACYAYLDAYTIALLGTKQFAQNKTDAIENLQPLYYQEFIAGIPKRTSLLQNNKPA
ncbi:MAG TPA: tRNA (adenosine(37)-N6)-threonylcarbamoyltransferase complex dimerization subunit type 1 TsaB [bacterium]|nr:tRNA (adenosine(37)-N6)-threonylcarbamoyltransferase complex dimerization subunit type 1 TsaB [bacterium]HPN44778.1 tRNA (adenosine(37)-N6)-threonylcarbamoyltransferase complex dimerization subunit type 1 TsaB [bacterium]